mmetsp:Transcript_49737/g.144309  ORF Transcript_49737/g.144309 Transcript_49737/m.144309 type:complete len:299 (-) Transcript_49737:239-1135(-)
MICSPGRRAMDRSTWCMHLHWPWLQLTKSAKGAACGLPSTLAVVTFGSWTSNASTQYLVIGMGALLGDCMYRLSMPMRPARSAPLCWSRKSGRGGGAPGAPGKLLTILYTSTHRVRASAGRLARRPPCRPCGRCSGPSALVEHTALCRPALDHVSGLPSFSPRRWERATMRYCEPGRNPEMCFRTSPLGPTLAVMPRNGLPEGVETSKDTSSTLEALTWQATSSALAPASESSQRTVAGAGGARDHASNVAMVLLQLTDMEMPRMPGMATHLPSVVFSSKTLDDGPTSQPFESMNVIL